MPVVTRQLAFTDCRANSGSILKVRHKLRQTSIGECPSRQSQSVDGILDCRRLSFDLSELRSGAPPLPRHGLRTWEGRFERVDDVLRAYDRRPNRALRRAALHHATQWILRRQEAGERPVRSARPSSAPINPALLWRVRNDALHAVEVKLTVDVYEAAGGDGRSTGQLRAGTPDVELVQACQDNWCHVRWPGHEGSGNTQRFSGRVD